ncbi:antibiotic biosynthesis monooxygenase [Litorimonas sp. RW-G-Af-16]|uniref:antibiotic biosynthesis monooxygenase n=1 Tax=Litorimonas sp. RW-G-Af-16 TaxID=3241168 RepID=UPI00390C5754
MYAVCYRFTVIDAADAEEFVALWSGVTEYFKTHCGALGSRLHQTGDAEFFAYAQWPSQAVHDAASDHEVGQDFVKMRVRWSEIAHPTEVVFAGDVAANLFNS